MNPFGSPDKKEKKPENEPIKVNSIFSWNLEKSDTCQDENQFVSGEKEMFGAFTQGTFRCESI